VVTVETEIRWLVDPYYITAWGLRACTSYMYRALKLGGKCQRAWSASNVFYASVGNVIPNWTQLSCFPVAVRKNNNIWQN